MNKKSMLIAGLAVSMLLMSSVSMAATPNAVTDSVSSGLSVDQGISGTGVALAAGDRLRDGSCGNTPVRDGSGNPNAPRRGGGGGRR